MAGITRQPIAPSPVRAFQPARLPPQGTWQPYAGDADYEAQYSPNGVKLRQSQTALDSAVARGQSEATLRQLEQQRTQGAIPGSAGSTSGSGVAPQSTPLRAPDGSLWTQKLLSELMSNNTGGYTDVPLPDFSGMQGQQQQLQSRLSELIAGRGIDVGDVSGNSEAVANRVAVERSAGQQQQAEAERLAASGMTGSGESDARNAQIREQSGTQIGGFNANLAGRLRSEAQTGAIQGAGLSLNNLQQQMAEQEGLFSSRMEQEQAKRLAAQSKRSEQMQLLKQLLAMQES